ncbi:hypothetical protein [Paraburkholderia sp. PGU19]|uniref:hypothetical protein n=1 Tax=Paraburkholderia sp. PGU19 TaxID=2735434 RepID=UPI0015DAB8B0|nr:hypothetical protein [Paraburkholderia sp. PGU19]
MSDDDRYATKAAIGGPLAPASLSPGAETATSNARANEITAALIFWKAATAAARLSAIEQIKSASDNRLSADHVEEIVGRYSRMKTNG